MPQWIVSIDQNVLLWIQDVLRKDALTPFMMFITKLGDKGIFWIAISVLLLIPKKTRLVGIMSLVALALAGLVDNVILKNVVDRTRPYEVVDGLTNLLKKQSDSSFPSGHTGSSFAAATAIFLGLPKKYSFLALVLATLIAFTRLYLGVHYPTDILAGILIGVALGIISYLVCTCLQKRFQKKHAK